MAGFNIGDVVRLKSGGPSMTVTTPVTRDDASYCFCMWFDTAHQAQPLSGQFKIDALEKVTL